MLRRSRGVQFFLLKTHLNPLSIPRFQEGKLSKRLLGGNIGWVGNTRYCTAVVHIRGETVKTFRWEHRLGRQYKVLYCTVVVHINESIFFLKVNTRTTFIIVGNRVHLLTRKSRVRFS